MFEIDMHFYVSFVGTEAERGDKSRSQVASDLARSSSLSTREATQLINTLVDAGKLKIRRGKLTIA